MDGPNAMADYSIDPEQVCQDIDAVAERAQSATSNDANALGDYIRQARERITRFIRDLDAVGNAENWNDREKIDRMIDLDDLLNASIDPTLSNEAQIYRVARQALPRHRR
jgi:hypothetical protein